MSNYTPPIATTIVLNLVGSYSPPDGLSILFNLIDETEITFSAVTNETEFELFAEQKFIPIDYTPPLASSVNFNFNTSYEIPDLCVIVNLQDYKPFEAVLSIAAFTGAISSVVPILHHASNWLSLTSSVQVVVTAKVDPPKTLSLSVVTGVISSTILLHGNAGSLVKTLASITSSFVAATGNFQYGALTSTTSTLISSIQVTVFPVAKADFSTVPIISGITLLVPTPVSLTLAATSTPIVFSCFLKVAAGVTFTPVMAPVVSSVSLRTPIAINCNLSVTTSSVFWESRDSAINVRLLLNTSSVSSSIRVALQTFVSLSVTTASFTVSISGKVAPHGDLSTGLTSVTAQFLLQIPELRTLTFNRSLNNLVFETTGGRVATWGRFSSSLNNISDDIRGIGHVKLGFVHTLPSLTSSISITGPYLVTCVLSLKLYPSTLDTSGILPDIKIYTRTNVTLDSTLSSISTLFTTTAIIAALSSQVFVVAEFRLRTEISAVLNCILDSDTYGDIKLLTPTIRTIVFDSYTESPKTFVRLQVSPVLSIVATLKDATSSFYTLVANGDLTAFVHNATASIYGKVSSPQQLSINSDLSVITASIKLIGHVLLDIDFETKDFKSEFQLLTPIRYFSGVGITPRSITAAFQLRQSKVYSFNLDSTLKTNISFGGLVLLQGQSAVTLETIESSILLKTPIAISAISHTVLDPALPEILIVTPIKAYLSSFTKSTIFSAVGSTTSGFFKQNLSDIRTSISLKSVTTTTVTLSRTLTDISSAIFVRIINLSATISPQLQDLSPDLRLHSPVIPTSIIGSFVVNLNQNTAFFEATQPNIRVRLIPVMEAATAAFTGAFQIRGVLASTLTYALLPDIQLSMKGTAVRIVAITPPAIGAIRVFTKVYTQVRLNLSPIIFYASLSEDSGPRGTINVNTSLGNGPEAYLKVGFFMETYKNIYGRIDSILEKIRTLNTFVKVPTSIIASLDTTTRTAPAIGDFELNQPAIATFSSVLQNLNLFTSFGGNTGRLAANLTAQPKIDLRAPEKIQVRIVATVPNASGNFRSRISVEGKLFSILESFPYTHFRTANGIQIQFIGGDTATSKNLYPIAPSYYEIVARLGHTISETDKKYWTLGWVFGDFRLNQPITKFSGNLISSVSEDRTDTWRLTATRPTEVNIRLFTKIYGTLSGTLQYLTKEGASLILQQPSFPTFVTFSLLTDKLKPTIELRTMNYKMLLASDMKPVTFALYGTSRIVGNLNGKVPDCFGNLVTVTAFRATALLASTTDAIASDVALQVVVYKFGILIPTTPSITSSINLKTLILSRLASSLDTIKFNAEGLATYLTLQFIADLSPTTLYPYIRLSYVKATSTVLFLQIKPENVTSSINAGAQNFVKIAATTSVGSNINLKTPTRIVGELSVTTSAVTTIFNGYMDIQSNMNVQLIDTTASFDLHYIPPTFLDMSLIPEPSQSLFRAVSLIRGSFDLNLAIETVYFFTVHFRWMTLGVVTEDAQYEEVLTRYFPTVYLPRATSYTVKGKVQCDHNKPSSVTKLRLYEASTGELLQTQIKTESSISFVFERVVSGNYLITKEQQSSIDVLNVTTEPEVLK